MSPWCGATPRLFYDLSVELRPGRGSGFGDLVEFRDLSPKTPRCDAEHVGGDLSGHARLTQTIDEPVEEGIDCPTEARPVPGSDRVRGDGDTGSVRELPQQ